MNKESPLSLSADAAPFHVSIFLHIECYEKNIDNIRSKAMEMQPLEVRASPTAVTETGKSRAAVSKLERSARWPEEGNSSLRVCRVLRLSEAQRN